MSMRNQHNHLNSNGHQHHDTTIAMHKSVTIVTAQRSNSLDYLNFEEKRKLIASSLSLSEILCGPAAVHAAKDVSVNTVIGEFWFSILWLRVLDVSIIHLLPVVSYTSVHRLVSI